MRYLLCMALLLQADIACGKAESFKEIPVDLADLPELGLGANTRYTYSFIPKKNHAAVKLVWETYGKEDEEEHEGAYRRIYTEDSKGNIKQIAIDLEDLYGALFYYEVADYNLDGVMDFRVVSSSGSGSGGTNFLYYSWKKGGFERWEEPEELGINTDPEGNMIYSIGRSGPYCSKSSYEIRAGRFHLVCHEHDEDLEDIENISDEQRAKLPPGTRTVLVKETWKDGKLLKTEYITDACVKF